MTQDTGKCQGRQLFTDDTKRVTCDLSSVGNQEGSNKMNKTRLSVGIVGYTPASQRVTCELSVLM